MHRRSFLGLAVISVLVPSAWISGLASVKGKALDAWSRFVRGRGFSRPSTVETTVLEVTTAPVTVFGQQIERGTIRQRNGRRGYSTARSHGVDVVIVNQLAVPTSVHWHGLIPPNQLDGVPYVTQPPIPPGETLRVFFPLEQSGTFWMHSHYGLQIQEFVAEPLLISGDDPGDSTDHDVTVMLRDFSYTPADQILQNILSGHRGGATLMAQSLAGFQWKKPRMLLTQGWDSARQRFAWREGLGALMQPDVIYDALLANERTLDDPQVIDVQPGESIRLRFIAGSAFMNFFLDLGELEGQLLSTDANPVEPIWGSVFQLAIAQRLDLRVVLPDRPGVFPVLALGEQSNLRCGVILRCGLRTPVPGMPHQVDQWTGRLDLSQEQQLMSSTPLASKAADVVIPVDLSGPVSPYRWGLNGKSYPYRDPYWVDEGQRVEIEFTNSTPMGHPMHLHGHEFQITAIDGQPVHGALRDTVMVPKGQSCRIAFDANHPGIWGFHCHIGYHHVRGMFNVLAYRNANLRWWDPAASALENLGFPQ